MTLARIYSRYDDQNNNLISTADNVSESNRDNSQRRWRVPVSWTTPPWMIKELGDPAFSRSEMDSEYPQFFYIPGGKVADCMVAKIQSDHLASQERAWRLRHASSIRCQMHAAARRKGQGDPGAGSFAKLTTHLLDILVSGNTGN
jgi:hypothetical protein